jgi:glycosyltransferase involved in cell wall biosynthesis
MDLSVIIPTYNGAERLPAVLDRLKAQVEVDTIAWEVVVVDNNSSDDPAAVVQQYQADWPAAVPLRYFVERQQGSGHARQCGIDQAAGELLGFLDDDNWPAPDWIIQAVQFSKAHPKVGAFGSEIVGEFEVQPPADWGPILRYLAIVQRGSTAQPYSPRINGLPPSAGLVVRRQAWLETVPRTLVLAGRVGDSLLCGEDWESETYLYQAGWEIWHNPAMKIKHWIPKQRVEWAYLRKNLLGVGLCRYQIRMRLLPRWQRPGMTLAYALSDSLKLIKHLLKHGRKIQLEAVPNCEWMLLWGTLVSPLYLFKLLTQTRESHYESVENEI